MLLAVAGIGGYFILKQTQNTAQAISDIPLAPFKAAGTVFHGVEEQVQAGSDFIGQSAAQILSNAGTVVSIAGKQLEQTPNNLLTALPAAVNALNILNPLTLPLTAAAITTNTVGQAINNLLTPTNVSKPTANVTSSKSSSSKKIVELLAPSKVTNAGTTSVGYYNPSTFTFTDTSGNKMSVAPSNVKANTATPFSTFTTNATSTAAKTSTAPKTTSKNYFGTSNSSSYFFK